MLNLPKKILLTRHLRSIGNVDKNHYNQIPDYRICLYHSYSYNLDLLKTSGIFTYLEQFPNFITHSSQFVRAIETAKFFTGKYTKYDDSFSSVLLHERRCKNDLNPMSDPVKDMDFYTQVESRIFTGKNKVFFKFPDGESGVEIYQRCLTWWNNFRLNCLTDLTYTDHNLHVVSHEGTMRYLLVMLTNTNFNKIERELSQSIQNGESILLELESNNTYKITNRFTPIILDPNVPTALNEELDTKSSLDILRKSYGR